MTQRDPERLVLTPEQTADLADSLLGYLICQAPGSTIKVELNKFLTFRGGELQLDSEDGYLVARIIQDSTH